MNNEKKFMYIMSVIALFFALVYKLLNFVIYSNDTQFVNVSITLLNILLMIIITIIILSSVVSYIILKNRKINKNIMKINLNIVNVMYPLVIVATKMFSIPKNEIRRVYVILNNKYIYSNNYNLKAEDIMLVTPHCIQKNFCKHKVTNDIENCRRCGQCNVEDLVKLKQKYNVKAFVATGGTLARKIIIENKPKAVIAIACERDLISGIQDVSKFPVIGILNKRPNGPCFNTEIDVEKVEGAIKFLLGGN
ncbi:DUF116 domain-containing protein [Tepidibacter hydrothermalis]|uniref:DUF116 domain-containing protein n=1 Tax=Tepidibacter hydrothermalis TaxID=3036126 RepID=A0ABY8E879_9FIRM|nr:DUF116 domain-containing protein [Tepidibacter hydrothermalis]WFD09101.1 DUF116 domain-containing protein [Tepidibacter hydrothermalis]